MKHLSLAILFFLFFIQTTNADNLKEYYAEINNAELSITAQDYKSAISTYNLAFTNKKEPFAIDIYNQTVCYIKSGNLKEAIAKCFTLAERGVGADFFHNNKIFEPLKVQSQWQQLLQKAEQVKAAFDLKNRSLTNKINMLFDADQDAHGLLRNINDQNQDSISNYVKDVDDSLSNQLMDIFKQNGFLTEFNLGITINSEFEIDRMPNFYIIILHNFQGIQRYDSLFLPILNNAVFNGKVKPDVYALMLDANVKNPSKFYGTSNIYWQYENKLYINKYYNESEIKNQINLQRSSIMLSSLDDYLKKILFNLKERGSGFEINAGVSRIGSFSDEESEKDFKENLTLITSDF